MRKGYREIDVKKIETGGEVVTLDELKTQLTISLTTTDFDTELTAMIKRCRMVVEKFCNLSIVRKTITLHAYFYSDWEIPYGPVIAIDSVKQRSGREGSGPVNYEDLSSGWNYEGEDFPTFSTDYCNALRLEYRAGYITVPDDLKLGILNECAYRFEHKGDALRDSIASQETESLVTPFKRIIWL